MPQLLIQESAPPRVDPAWPVCRGLPTGLGCARGNPVLHIVFVVPSFSPGSAVPAAAVCHSWFVREVRRGVSENPCTPREDVEGCRTRIVGGCATKRPKNLHTDANSRGRHVGTRVERPQEPNTHHPRHRVEMERRLAHERRGWRVDLWNFPQAAAWIVADMFHRGSRRSALRTVRRVPRLPALSSVRGGNRGSEARLGRVAPGLPQWERAAPPLAGRLIT